LTRSPRLLTAALAAVVLGSALPASAQTVTARDNELRLEQNVPNPFTPGVSPTIFTFTIPEESRVRLMVYNLLAQEVARLADETLSRGTHRLAWDGIDARGQPVPAGVYWYKLEVGDRRPLLRRLRVREASAALEEQG
jgi:flagellar hook assembly protein FlgD